MKRIMLASFGLLLAVSFWQAPLHAQGHIPALRAEGELKGLVTDLNDSRVAGAKVTLENKSYKFEAWTNDEGAFEVKVPIGEYQLKIESGGFKDYVKKRIRIEAEKMESINATLLPAESPYPLKIK